MIEVALGSLGELRNGANFTAAQMGRGVPIVNVKDITNSHRIDSDFLERADVRVDGEMLAREDDIFFVRSSVKLSGIGLVGRLTRCETPVVHCGFVIRFRPAAGTVFPEYLLYLMLSPEYRERLKGISAGAAIVNLSQTSLRNMMISLPPVPVQRRIARILSSYDELLENNRRRMALLETAARLLYEEWFARLRFPGHEHVRVVDGVAGGWKPLTLGDLCTDIREAANPSALDPDLPYIGLEHIPRRSITLQDWGRAAEVNSTKLRFFAGDIIFGKIRPYFHKVGMALVDGVASSDTIVMRPVKEDLRSLLLMTVSSDAFVAMASQTMREGSKMPRADWKLMRKYPVAVPPSGLLGAFNEIIAPMTAQLKTLALQSRKLRAGRDLLLPKLVSGEIAV